MHPGLPSFATAGFRGADSQFQFRKDATHVHDSVVLLADHDNTMQLAPSAE